MTLRGICGRCLEEKPPGPSQQLRLWEHRSDSPEGGWRAVGEVHAELVEGKQYDICPDCGEPLKTPEHRTVSALASGVSAR